ncbi:MAG: hypothetical protein KIT48_14470 [Pseudolabrys sp.]|nr:hypothetical protein [Pseudolabrys sp.]
MRRLAVITLAGLIAAAAPASAQSQQRTELAQQTPRQRIIISPRREPGPNAKRECQARLVEQHRPSGTVIVPVMHCWWQ